MKYVFIFLIFSLFLFTSCSAPQTVPSSGYNPTPAANAASDTAAVVAEKTPSFVVTYGGLTNFTVDNVKAVAKITSVSRRDDSFVLSIKVGDGENMKRAVKNQVIAFGNIRICVKDIQTDEAKDTIHATLIPTTSSKAVALYSLASVRQNVTCETFTSAIKYSSQENGDAKFFNSILETMSSDVGIINYAYELMLGRKPDKLSVEAWQFFIQKNGVMEFIEALSKSEEYLARIEAQKTTLFL